MTRSIEFASKNDLYSKKAFIDKLTDWDPSDIARITNVFDRIHDVSPNLLDNFADSRKIKLVIAENILDRHKQYSGLLPNALSIPGAILISARYLHSDDDDMQLFKTLVHELVHQSDPGNLVSFSPEWIGIAAPLMLKAKRLLSSTSAGSQRTKIIGSDGFLPSLLSTNNLSECMAECYAAYLCKNFIVDQSASETFQKFLVPSEGTRNYNTSFTRATKELTTGRISQALCDFKFAARTTENNPEPLLGMAYCYALNQNTSESIWCYRKALDIFKSLNVPKSDARLLYALKNLRAMESALQSAKSNSQK